MPSLKIQAVRGAFWSFIERFGQQGIQFVVGVVLARLLTPRDFGVLGMLSVFMALAQSVIDSGFGGALIQKQDASHTDESTVFWFNTAMGILFAALVFFAAPAIAAFYRMPLLVPITQVFSVNLVINAFGIVHTALLTKALAFKQRMWAAVAGVIVSGIVGIYMAWMGFGVWSLVAQGLVMNLVRTIGLWVVHPWRPAFVFSRASFNSLWGFGSKLMLSGMLRTFFHHVYTLVIGRVYSATELGLYSRGKRFNNLTSHSLSQVVAQVHFPLLSRMNGDAERMKRAFRSVLRLTLLVVMPMMGLLGIVGHNLFFILLGEQWLPAVPYFQVLCVTGMLYPIHLLNLDVVLAMGRSDVFLRLEVLKKILTVINITVTWRFGVLVMLCGQVVGSLVALMINTHFTRKFLGYGLAAQLSAASNSILATLGAVTLAWLAGWGLDISPWFVLPIQVGVGGVTGLLILLALRDDLLLEGLCFIRGKIVLRCEGKTPK